MKSVSSILFVFLLCFGPSCTKKEGKGGRNTIKGVVMASYYTKTTNVFTQRIPAANEEVYIIYGDNPGYGDKTATNYKGEFDFKYLQNGNYKVYVYSKDLSNENADAQVAVVKQVNLSSSSTIDENFEIAKTDKRDLTKGPYSISGTISVQFCNSDFSNCSQFFPSADYNVYIKRKDEPNYFDRIFSGVNGFYKFEELPAGKYQVYVASKNKSSATDSSEPPIITILKDVEIVESNIENIDLSLVD